jgi:hypothetical protein
MIPHDVVQPIPRYIRDSATLVTLAMAGMGFPPAVGYQPKPGLGHYRECDPIERQPRPVVQEAAVLHRGGKRLDPRVELRRRNGHS